MSVLPNKVDMSLDDIIKINKFEKKKQARLNKKAKARGGAAGDAGTTPRGRGRGRGLGRGRGKPGQQGLNRLKQVRTNLQRGKRGQRRGRGNAINRQNSGISPLKQSNEGTPVQQTLRGRGRGRGIQRGRGRGRGANVQGNKMVFTNSNLQSGQQFSASQHDIQRQRLDKTRQHAALLKEKQLALKNLQQAQKNIQNINQAIQKTSRESVVSQMRGINTNQNVIPAGRGRGRGQRKLLTKLIGQQGNINNNAPVRQLSHTSVTITNPTALNSNSSQNLRGRRRRWRKNSNSVKSEHFTIQVANQNLSSGGQVAPVRQLPQPQKSSVLDQLKLLKPAVATTYKFQKNVFAAPATGVSLSDRFSSTTSVGGGGDTLLEGRKVFI